MSWEKAGFFGMFQMEGNPGRGSEGHDRLTVAEVHRTTQLRRNWVSFVCLFSKITANWIISIFHMWVVLLWFPFLGHHEDTRLGKLSLRVLKVIKRGVWPLKGCLAFEASQAFLATNSKKSNSFPGCCPTGPILSPTSVTEFTALSFSIWVADWGLEAVSTWIVRLCLCN